MRGRRTTYAFLLVLVLVFGAPIVPAQQSGHEANIGETDNTVTVNDAQLDVQLLAAPKQNPTPQNASNTGEFDHLDIVKLVFGQETEKDFQVALTMRSLTSTLPNTGTAQRTISFTYGKVTWTIRPGSCQGQRGGTPSTSPPPPTTGCLSGSGGGQRGGYKSIPMITDAGSKTYTFMVQKADLFNENRVPARFGEALKNITVYASQFFAGVFFVPGGDPTGGVTATDRAPDTGVAPDFVFNKGSNGHGHLGLYSADPIRVSNGEATTIVFKVDLYNLDKDPMSVQLEVRDAYPDWSVRIPTLVKVPGATTLTFPVIVALPFTHFHGKTAEFKVHAQAVEDPNAYADLDLGVFWTEIPQPSAHHETADGGTFLHAKPNDNAMFSTLDPVFPQFVTWMNGVDQDPDPDATDDNVPMVFNNNVVCVFGGVQNCGVPPTYKVTWQFPLSPSLLLGLDFNLGKDGQLAFDLVPKLAATSVKLAVDLKYCDPTQQTTGGGMGGGGQGGGFNNGSACNNYNLILAHGEQATGSFSPNSPFHAEIPIKIDPKWDLVPYKKGHNIRLDVTVTTDTPQATAGQPLGIEFVTNKARLRLPLIEYHDPIDQAFENVGTLAISAKSPFEKQMNPGKTAVYFFEVKSNATDKQRAHVEVEGVNSEWAEIMGDPEFDLAPGQIQNVSLAVHVPADAVDQERAELFFVATNVRDPSIVAVTRLRTTVVTSPDIPDEVSQASTKSGGGKSPGLGLVPVGLSLVALAALLRRRDP